MNEDLHKLDYAPPPPPVDGPTAWHHVLDAIALSIVAFDALLIGYGVAYGYETGDGNFAVQLILLSSPILLILVLVRSKDRTCRTILFYLNAVLVGILWLMILGAVCVGRLPEL